MSNPEKPKDDRREKPATRGPEAFERMSDSEKIAAWLDLANQKNELEKSKIDSLQESRKDDEHNIKKWLEFAERYDKEQKEKK